MKKVFILIHFMVLTCASYSQKVIAEYGVLEEYHGRENRTAVSGIDVSADGSNMSSTDDQGFFVLQFDKDITAVEHFDFDKDGYVIFNRDAVSQWKISNNFQDRFHVVICNQRDLRKKILEYYEIFDGEAQKNILRQKEELNKLKLSFRETEERLHVINEEYQRLQREAKAKAEMYARVDENQLQDELYEALCLFRNNKLVDALSVFDRSGLWENAANKCDALNESKKNTAQQKADLKLYLPSLSQYIEILKMGGQRNDDALIPKLNQIVEIYQSIDERIYDNDLSAALYDLGCIYQPISTNYISSVLDGGFIDKVKALHEDYDKAYDYFSQSASLGNSSAMYQLGRLCECEGSGYYDLFMAKEMYAKSSKLGNSLAAQRMEDFFDFGQRDRNGNMIYYHIKNKKGKNGEVKVTYLDAKYATYKGLQDGMNDYDTYGELCIPQIVSHEGVKFKVVEIGRNAFRLSGVKKLVIPEGVDSMGYFALRSAHGLTDLELPASLKYIDKECFVRCTPQRITINSKNKYYAISKDSCLFEKSTGNVIFDFKNGGYSTRDHKVSSYSWLEGEALPARVEKSDIFAPNGLYDCKFTSVVFPENLDTIPELSFYFTRLKTLTIPNYIKEIGNEAFRNSNELLDVVFPNAFIGLGSNVFGHCQNLSELYCMSSIPFPADINTFDDGRALRFLHVPQGTSSIYRSANGWKSFNHIIDDIVPQTPFYDVLYERVSGNFVGAIGILNNLLQENNCSNEKISQYNIQKAMLCYHLGDKACAFSAAIDATSGYDTLLQVEAGKALDMLLSYNFEACSLMADCDSLASVVVDVLLDTYRASLERKHFEAIETAKSIIEAIIRNSRNSESLEMNYEICYRLNDFVDLCLLADSLNNIYNFKMDKTCGFVETTYDLVKLASDVILRESQIMRRELGNLYNIDERLGKCKDVSVLINLYTSNISKYELNHVIYPIDVIEINLFKTWGNLAYIYSRVPNHSTESMLFENFVYNACVQNLDKKEVELLLEDLCASSKKNMPPSYEEIPQLIKNLKNNVIPDSLMYVQTMPELSKTQYINELISEARKCSSNGDYLQMISCLCKVGYFSSYALRLLGLNCYLGQGIGVNYEYAKTLLMYAYKYGDKDVPMLLLGVINEEEGNYDLAVQSYSISDIMPAKMRLIHLQEHLGQVEDAVSLLKSLLLLADENDEELDKIRSGLALRLNHMAYQDAYSMNFEDALRHIDLAISLYPTEGNFYDSKGEILLWMNDADNAIDNWNIAQRLTPELIFVSSLYKKLKHMEFIQ